MTPDILLLTRYGPQGASSRVRFYQYIPSLEAAGHRVEVLPMFSDAYVSARYADPLHVATTALHGYARRALQLARLAPRATLWIEYELLPWIPFLFERAFYKSERPIVVDYDDAVFHRYGLHPNPLVRRWLGRKIERVMQVADVVVVGNDYLAQHARDVGARRVEVVPSVVDLSRYRQRPSFNDRAFVVGWIGSPATTPYLQRIGGTLRDTQDIPGLALRNVGGSPWEPAGIATKTLPWRIDTEVAAMLDFDVGVMPLPDDPWTRGKCGYKLIQYMGCGLPVVASPVGANAQIVEHGKTGFLATTPAEWSEALRTLARSPELRLRMGRAGFERARRGYDLTVTAPRLVTLFDELVGEARERGSAPRTERPATLGGHVRSRFAPAVWTAIANALPRAALLLSGLYVARRFGPEDFARYSLAIVTITMAGGIFSMMMIAIGSKYVSEIAAAHRGRPGAGFAALMLFGVGLAAVLGTTVYNAAEFLARLLGHPDALIDLLRLSAPVVAASVVYGTVNGLVVGSARFATAATATVAGSAVFAALLVPLADHMQGAGALLALCGLYAVTALGELSAVGRVALADFRASRLASQLALLKPILAFMLPMLLFIATIPALVWSCNAILARGSAPLASIARFNVAYNWYAVAAFVPNVLAQVEFVNLARARSRGDAAGLRPILRFAILQNLLVMLPLIGIGIASADLLANLFRVDDADGRMSVQLMLTAALVASLSNPTGVFLAVVDRIWLATGLSLAQGAVTLATAWLLRDQGAIGMGYAFVAGCVFHLVTAVTIAFRTTVSVRSTDVAHPVQSV